MIAEIYLVTETESWSETALRIAFEDIETARDQVVYLTRGNVTDWSHDVQDDGSERHERITDRGVQVVTLEPIGVYATAQNV